MESELFFINFAATLEAQPNCIERSEIKIQIQP